MEFLAWHYSKGLDFYLNKWSYSIRWTLHYFSIGLLLQTLFAPWKRLIEVDKKPGFSFQRYFETLSFNLISRGIGAAVRIILVFVSMILLFAIVVSGAIGVIFWLLVPIVGISVYNKVQNTPKNYAARLLERIKVENRQPLEILLDCEAGQFLSQHINIPLSELAAQAQNTELNFEGFEPSGYTDILKLLIEKEVWNKEYLRKQGLLPEDLLLVSEWWDQMQSDKTEFLEEEFGRPGLALELLFGYTPTLDQYSSDLSAPQEYSHHLIGRENVVQRMERVLTAGKSVLLVGEPGVGKKTVVLEFAHRAAMGKLGSSLAHRRILEFDYNMLLSEAIDLNQKKTKLSQAMKEAAYAGNTILMIRDIHRLTNPQAEGFNFTDVFEEVMEQKDLKIIGVSTPSDYERFIVPNLRLRKHLENVEVTPPTMDEAFLIMLASAKDWESKRYITFTIQSLKKILNESDKYVTETPFPEKALELLDSVIFYAEQNNIQVITVNEANIVLAEKTGVSFASLTEAEKSKLTIIEDIIHERLVDQEAAVNLIGKSLRSKTVGVSDNKKPIGSFMFLGPTGVGKTETAKVLAKVYFESEENIIRFDMAEYSGSEGLERLIGSLSKNQPGVLTTAIKNKPASLLLLDEFEKATPEIYNLFLSLLDEGQITDAFGKKVLARNLFVIATSNAGAEYIRQLVSTGIGGQNLQEKVLEHVLSEKIYTPELLNRFDGVVVYEPLGSDELIKIARILLDELAGNLKKKGIVFNITDELVQKIASDGYDPAFGARPMNRIINLILGDIIGSAIISGQVNDGDTIGIVPMEGKDQYQLQKTS